MRAATVSANSGADKSLKVEVDDEVVSGPVRVHRHRGGTGGGTENLLRELVELTEGVGNSWGLTEYERVLA